MPAVDGSNMKKGISEIRKVRAEVISAMRFTNSSLAMRKARTAPRDGRKIIVLSKGNRGSIRSPFSSPAPVLGTWEVRVLSNDQIPNDHHRAEEDRQRIVTHKARLHSAQPGAIPTNEGAGLVHCAIDEPHLHL